MSGNYSRFVELGRKIVAVGRNYRWVFLPYLCISLRVNFVQTLHKFQNIMIYYFFRDHAAELGNAIPDKPLIFMKPATAYITEGSPIKVK